MTTAVQTIADLEDSASCLENAADLLQRLNIPCTRIVHVDVDAILYLNGAGRAMTAWLVRHDGRSRWMTEAGFPAERKVTPIVESCEPTGEHWGFG